MSRWDWLIDHARLEIYDFSIDTQTNFSVYDRYLPFYVMSYIQEGLTRVTVDGQTVDLPAGSMMLIPAYTRHSQFMPEGAAPTTFLWWHFNITVGGLDLMKLLRFPFVAAVRDTHAFEALFYEYRQCSSQHSSLPGIIKRRAKEYEIMAFLFSSITEDSNAPGSHVEDIPDAFFDMMKFIIEHPEHNVTLEDLSARYYLNPSYISTRFRKLFGVSPVRLHHQVVTDHAMAALREDAACTVSSLAQRYGFRDVSSFTHFFKARVGCSPSDYRRKYFG